MKYFSDTHNVLMNIHETHKQPYPYAVTGHCLPEPSYNALARSRPDWRSIAGREMYENNKRIDLPAYAALQSGPPKEWKAFIEYHTSQDFYQVILSKFGVYFDKYYPQLKTRELRPVVRGSGVKGEAYLGCQIGINTPVKEQGTVSKPHLDSPNELWACLLYMKEPDDNAGGDLVIYGCKKPTVYGKRLVPEEGLVHQETIPYAPNTMACFMNSPYSVHAVTERKVTDKPRLLVNITLEFDKPLFKLPCQ